MDNQPIALPLKVEVLSTELEAVTVLPEVHQILEEPKTLDQKKQRLAALATDTRLRLKQSALDIYYIGSNLLEARRLIEHGEFLLWLKHEFGMGKTSAYEFIHVAEAFQSKFPIVGNLLNQIAPTALYKLAAPSTPEAARVEAIEYVKTGVMVGSEVAREIIKKHKPPKTSKTQYSSADAMTQQQAINQVEAPVLPESNNSLLKLATSHKVALLPIPSSASQLETKLELDAIHSATPIHEVFGCINRVESPGFTVPQPTQLAEAADVPNVWWRLSGEHLLYCGHPNAEEFLTRIPEKVQFLLAFPPSLAWYSRITSEARIILPDYLPIFREPKLLDEVLETLILKNTRVGDLVVNCFLPSPKILSIIHRLDRRVVLVDRDYKRCKAVVTNWKTTNLLAERLN